MCSEALSSGQGVESEGVENAWLDGRCYICSMDSDRGFIKRVGFNCLPDDGYRTPRIKVPQQPLLTPVIVNAKHNGNDILCAMFMGWGMQIMSQKAVPAEVQGQPSAVGRQRPHCLVNGVAMQSGNDEN